MLSRPAKGILVKSRPTGPGRLFKLVPNRIPVVCALPPIFHMNTEKNITEHMTIYLSLFKPIRIFCRDFALFFAFCAILCSL